MFFSIPFVKNSEYLNNADELRIKVEFDQLGDNLINFLEDREQKAPNQRIMIQCADYYKDLNEIDNWLDVENDIILFMQKLIDIADRLLDYNIIIETYSTKYLQDLKDAGYPTYYVLPFAKWESLSAFLSSYPIDEISIIDALGFEMPDVKKVCDRFKVKVRVTADVATLLEKFPKDEWYLKFFVAPNDLPHYEKYIDVLSLGNKKDLDRTKVDTIYEIYARNGEWGGPLDILIENLDSSLDGNAFMRTEWGKHRNNCNRACIKGFTCHICPSQISIAKNMTNMGLKFVPNDNSKEE